MSDFGSLLNQLKSDVKQLASAKSNRPAEDEAAAATALRNDNRPNKKRRLREEEEEHQVIDTTNHSQDAATFPPVKKIYCLCPANVQTGGPEALHQLCDEINRRSSSASSSSSSPASVVRAYMLYVKSSSSRDGRRRRIIHVPQARTPVAYRDLPFVAVVDDDVNPLFEPSSDTLLIWPECWTEELLHYLDMEPSSSATATSNTFTSPSLSSSSCRCQCAIWWLSVDNNMGKFQQWHRNDIVHLYQSEYAKRYVSGSKGGAKYVYPMTEYISLSNMPSNDDDTKNKQRPDEEEEVKNGRTIDVLYNPLKGMHYTDAIRKRSGSAMTIRPLSGGGGPDGREQRLSPVQVRQLLQRAKIYIDFGPHPGMDRLPREAALAGCCVVTNCCGAARHDEDMPLPSRYKVQEFNADDIHKILHDILTNFDDRSKDFDGYRDWIRGQRVTMQKCVSSFLNEVVDKRMTNTT